MIFVLGLSRRSTPASVEDRLAIGIIEAAESSTQVHLVAYPEATYRTSSDID